MAETDQQKPAAGRVPRPPEDVAAARALAVEIARSLKDDKCERINVLDVSAMSQICDVMVIASGTSDRQMRSAAFATEEIGERHGAPALRKNENDAATWIVVDYGDVLVHLFEPNTRAYYDLEMLWGDADRVEWRREGDPPEGAVGMDAM